MNSIFKLIDYFLVSNVTISCSTAAKPLRSGGGFILPSNSPPPHINPVSPLLKYKKPTYVTSILCDWGRVAPVATLCLFLS